MKRYVHQRTGAVRMSSGELGWPYRAATDEDGDAPSYSSMSKDELIAAAEVRGLDASGTKAEIIERLEA